jgi:hypothetical protein
MMAQRIHVPQRSTKIAKLLNGAALMILAVSLSLFVATCAGAEPGYKHNDLHGKLIVGFQGWFMCPNDGRGAGNWIHWFTKNTADESHMHFDIVPDVQDLPESERCPTKIQTPDGPLELFSDQNASSVMEQFRWMRDHSIDVVALQRFLVDVDPTKPTGKPREWTDRVLQNSLAAADATGRGLFIMYDIAVANPATWTNLLLDDWKRLLAEGLLSHPSYQRHAGRLVLAIAGVGLNDRPGSAAETAELIRQLRSVSEPFGGVMLIASSATNWRTLDWDAKTDPEWAKTYAMFDIISPWTVDRYSDDATYDRFKQTRLDPDMKFAAAKGLEYLPVIFPGYSAHNLMESEGRPAPLKTNSIPRECGRFLWRQAVAARSLGARMLYIAMFDEVDEGTAIFKLDPESRLPTGEPMLGIDDNCPVGPDWYLRVADSISHMLKAPIGRRVQFPLAIPSKANER